MMLSKINLLLFFTLIILTSDRLFAQESNLAVVNSLNKVIRPIETLEADSSFTDIDFLKETLKDKELIAIGEVSHGTAEVFKYKDRLVRFLVTNLGYKAIAFESDYIAMENIDNYINGKTDSLVFIYGTPVISTNRLMIEWLRKYNLNQSDSDKVHVYGIEARGFSNVIKKIIEVNRSLDQADKTLLEKIALKPFNKIDKAEIKGMKAVLTKLQKIEGSDLDKHYTESLSQIVYGYYHETTKRVRDHDMANNVIWLKERAKDQKLILMAHNGHVAKSEIFNVPATGTYLDRKYGAKYFVMATDFNHGKAYVNVYMARNKPMLGFQPYYYPEVNSKKGYEFYFKQCRFRNFIIEIDAALKDPVLDRFLTQPLDMRMIGALSIPANTRLSISKNFDLIIYFDKTSSAFN